MEIKDLEPQLKKIIKLNPKEWKKQVNSLEWDTKGFKQYLLSLAEQKNRKERYTCFKLY